MDSVPLKSAVGCLILVLTLAGCLPSSCRRVESRAISPADSLSRQIAARMTPDTLALAWQESGPDDGALEYPRTVRFGPDGRLFVSDVERNSVYLFTAGGAFVEEMTWEGAAFPYLAGLRGDTVLVFNPEARHVDFVVRGASVHRLPTPGDLPRGALQSATATGEAVYVQVGAKDAAGYVVRLDAQGRVQARASLPGPHWRHAGLLRPWDDALLSLSGFSPVVDVLPADLSTPPDTLALVGFDSPMLRRTFAFMRGETYEAPLLSSAAAPAADRLFVLNMRPGWLRLDAYDRAGRLQHILVQPDPAFDNEFYPIDVAVRTTEAGHYEIAVAVVKPVPVVKLYRWQVP